MNRCELLELLQPYVAQTGTDFVLAPKPDVDIQLSLGREYYDSSLDADESWLMSFGKMECRIWGSNDEDTDEVFLIPYAHVGGVCIRLFSDREVTATECGVDANTTHMVIAMDKSYWVHELEKYVVDSTDRELAARGIVQPKPGYILSFLIPYASVSVLPQNQINLSNDHLMTIMVPEYGHETIHKVPWGSIGGLSITFESGNEQDTARLAREILLDGAQRISLK